MDGLLVNDVHSRLNPTRVAGLLTPNSLDELVAMIEVARGRGQSLAVSGGRHAMGGQQFAEGHALLDTRGLSRLLEFDERRGLAEFEAGVCWPDLVSQIRGRSRYWGIRQKQTGADNLTLGGAASANAHGRGLTMGPIVDDIEAIRLLMSDGSVLVCSRSINRELFSLAIGGYGLFGVIATVTLRLSPRQKLRRMVDIVDIDDAVLAVRRKVAEGCVYGDFQYAIDPGDDSFLRRGVFACYAPARDGAADPDHSADLQPDQWGQLLALAHTDKPAAFSLYAQHYLSTHGRLYWSDEMQLSTYIPSYEQFLADSSPHSLMIGELYVPPEHLRSFLARARQILREEKSEDIYGTIRAIQPDRTTFLAWAKREYACIIFNLRTAHTEEGISRTRIAFRRLQAAAIELGGSFFLTYHRYATREQVEQAYPMFRQFLALKRQYDPGTMFTSDWYRHYAQMLG